MLLFQSLKKISLRENRENLAVTKKAILIFDIDNTDADFVCLMNDFTVVVLVVVGLFIIQIPYIKEKNEHEKQQYKNTTAKKI